MKVLNIYGQFMEHEDAGLIGNREALEALRDKISEALATGKAVLGSGNIRHPTEDLILFASDGEGYSLKIECGPENWEDEFWQKVSGWYVGYNEKEWEPWEEIPKAKEET